MTINAGGIWNNNTVNAPITLRGGITNNGTFNAGTGTYTFNTNNQALTGTFSIPNVTATGITLTNNGTLAVGTALSGTGGLTQGVNATLNIGGTSAITTLTASNNGNTVNFSGAAQSVNVSSYYNLTISGSGNKTMAGNASVDGTLNLTAGTFTVGNRTLTLKWTNHCRNTSKFSNNCDIQSCFWRHFSRRINTNQCCCFKWTFYNQYQYRHFAKLPDYKWNLQPCRSRIINRGKHADT